MPIRTRSNRIEKVAAQRLIASGAAYNDRGLCTLPDEIYLEIVSHLPNPSLFSNSVTKSDPDACQRYGTLKALSETCRNLRRIFLRYLCQRIEVLNGMETSRGILNEFGVGQSQGKWHAEELIRQLEVVTIRNPNLAQYVNAINIYLLDYSLDTVFEELARCMALFPNLHSIQFDLQFGIPQWTFASHKYPGIREASFNFHAASLRGSLILEACQNLTALYWHYSYPTVLESTLHLLPHLKKLDLIRTNNSIITAIPKHLRKLEELILGVPTLSSPPDILAGLAALPCLHTIVLAFRLPTTTSSTVRPGSYATWETQPEVQQWIFLSQKILKSSPKKEGVMKRVLLLTQLMSEPKIIVVS